MDIDLLAKLIKEIALEHDEIALPEVGTFVAELSPAVFSEKGYSIVPPYRKLTFRQRISSDNLLTEAYSKAAGISVDEASADLSEFLKGLKDILTIRKTVIFPGLGKMRATKENVFFFVPDADLDIYPDGYGLDSVSLRTHVGEQQDRIEREDVPATVAKSQSSATEVQEPVDTAPTSLKAILIILGIAVVLALALAILGRVAPELVDKMLYTAEDYQLLHS